MLELATDMVKVIAILIPMVREPHTSINILIKKNTPMKTTTITITIMIMTMIILINKDKSLPNMVLATVIKGRQVSIRLVVNKDTLQPSTELQEILEITVKGTLQPNIELLETKVKDILPLPNMELLETKVKATLPLPNMELPSKAIPLTLNIALQVTKVTLPLLNSTLLKLQYRLRLLPKLSPELTLPNTDLIIYLFIILRNFNFN